MDGAGAGLYSKRLSSAWSSGRRVPLANHHIQVLILVLLFCFLLLMMKALKVMFICERKAHDDKKWLMKTLFPWWIDFAASTSGIQRLPYLFRIVTIPTYSSVILFLHSAMFGILCCKTREQVPPKPHYTIVTIEQKPHCTIVYYRTETPLYNSYYRTETPLHNSIL